MTASRPSWPVRNQQTRHQQHTTTSPGRAAAFSVCSGSNRTLLRRQPLLCLGRVVCLHFPGERLVFLRQFEQPGPGLLIGDAGG